SEYIAALKEYGKEYDNASFTQLIALAPTLRKQNSFKVNPNDETVVLDTNNLTEAERIELSLFASDLLNQVRRALGTQETVVTLGAVEFANRVATSYVADNWNLEQIGKKGHDAKAINDAARTMGLTTISDERVERGSQIYENLYAESIQQKTMTKANAKRSIYQALLSFLFSDVEYLHALSIAGVSGQDMYLGVDLSTTKGMTAVHFLIVADSEVMDQTRFDKTAIANPHTSDQILANYHQAQASLTQATTANNQAQEAKTKALNEQTVAQAQVATAQSRLATTNTVPILTPKAETNLVLAQEAVQKAEVEHKEAQANLANLQADVKVKQANLAKVKQTLTQKQATLDKAKEQLSIEQDKLNQVLAELEAAQVNVVAAQTQLSTAQTTLKEAQAYLVKLEEAPARLENAKARLLQATNSLKAKEATLTEALETLAELKQEEAKALKHYQTVLSAYQAVLEAQRQVELAKQYETIIHEGGQPVPVVDGTGRITGYVSEVPKAPAQTSKPITQTVPTKNTEASLPATGTKTSSLTVLGLALATLVFFSRKKKEG
ncbi:TPA: SEC10/PgrA surface exclusion domain-containing protein, partial [Streptococcus suis]|nr:SEC10/PgrA surface exclusion domain-containing protein [Streptococcus suis]